MKKRKVKIKIMSTYKYNNYNYENNRNNYSGYTNKGNFHVCSKFGRYASGCGYNKNRENNNNGNNTNDESHNKQ